MGEREQRRKRGVYLVRGGVRRREEEDGGSAGVRGSCAWDLEMGSDVDGDERRGEEGKKEITEEAERGS